MHVQSVIIRLKLVEVLQKHPVSLRETLPLSLDRLTVTHLILFCAPLCVADFPEVRDVRIPQRVLVSTARVSLDSGRRDFPSSLRTRFVPEPFFIRTISRVL